MFPRFSVCFFRTKAGRDAILSVFLKVLNEMQGFCPDHPHIAHMERYLQGKGKLEPFQQAFQEASGSSWQEERDAYEFNHDQVIEAWCAATGQSKEAAEKWIDKAEDNFSVTIENFCKWVRTLGPMCRNTLLQKMTDLMGVEAFRPAINGKRAEWFELHGASEKLTDQWSSRRKEILAEAESSRSGISSVKARQNANLRTRRPKGNRPNNDELHRRWQAEARSLGQTQESLTTIIGRRMSCDVEERIQQAITESNSPLSVLGARSSTL